MKANLSQREPAMLEHWKKIDLYGKIRNQCQGRPTFILHDGPPYANGEIHLGHAVNKILKDIIIKARTLDGYDAPYVPGWDCHGLPIELQVEKKLGKVGDKVDAKTFRKTCRDYAAQQVEKQRSDFKRLGIFGDWEQPYLTMHFKTEADIVRSLGKIIQAGHLKRGMKPVHWCIHCGSALAEAEVEYQDRTSPSIDVRFRVVDEKALLGRFTPTQQGLGEGYVSVVIWTTTPWTLPANQAVALHPGATYALVEWKTASHGYERLIVAEALTETVMARYGCQDHYTIVGHCQGQALEGFKLAHPFYLREVPIILGDHVTLETGTGAVHTAPGHGLEDYLAGQHYNLPIDNPVGPDGRFLPNTPIFAGQEVFAANLEVIKILKEREKLLHSEKIHHSYPHCWRHKTPLIFRATYQWFITMDGQDLRKNALAAIGKVAWHPEWGEERIRSMIEGRPDWCISRQRAWGVPIPLFIHKESGHLHPKTIEWIEQIALLIEKEGIDAWFNLLPETLLGEETTRYEMLKDTLDVWFDSGVTHYSVLEQDSRLSYPADLYLEGSDQHRGWFQSSLLTSVAMHGQAPYRAVLTHGFTVDEEGRKMSKSLGNVISPQEIVNTLGADILRLWVAQTNYRGEMSLSKGILDRLTDLYRRIRNTLRFLLANQADFNPEQDLLPQEEWLLLDRWIVSQAYQLQKEVKDHYEHYEFHLICQKIHHFCAVELGSFYLDVIKDRQYTVRAESPARRSAQNAMYHITEAMTRWLTPILSFTAEEVWGYIPGQRGESVFLETWWNLPATDLGNFDDAFWATLLYLRDVIAKHLEQLRSEGKIGSSLDAEVILYTAPSHYDTLSLLGEELRFAFLTSEAKVEELQQCPQDAQRISLPDGETLGIVVNVSVHKKCGRCWHHRPEVGESSEHPDLCGRCVTNIVEEGEQRKFI